MLLKYVITKFAAFAFGDINAKIIEQFFQLSLALGRLPVCIVNGIDRKHSYQHVIKSSFNCTCFRPIS